MKLLALAICLLCCELSGCFKPPVIPGYHWHCGEIGCTLYDANGIMVATVNGQLGAIAAQGCPHNMPDPCKYFETTDQAFEYIRSVEVQKQ